MSIFPFGYKMINGVYEVDKLDEEIVSWIFDRHIRYSEHPPAVLVESVIEEYKISKTSIYLMKKLKEWFLWMIFTGIWIKRCDCV